jgi:serine/threonine-protein kinase RsbW
MPSSICDKSPVIIMDTLSRVTLPAIMENLEALVAFVARCAEEAGFDPKKISEMEIAAEEALVNVIHYAYEAGTGDIEVACGLEDNEKFVIEMADSGIPFDPLTRAEPDISTGISDREIGGLGILLIRKLMDDVRYRHSSGKNVLTLLMRKGNRRQ